MRTTLFVSPSDIERETGLGKDQLRKWRQRYNYPPIESTADGKASYSRKTVDQLCLIKRLLEGGFRPSQVVGIPTADLEKLKLGLALSVPVVRRDKFTQTLIDVIKRADMTEFQVLLAERRATGSLTDFICETVAPLLTNVGDAWKLNEIEIFHEHLCTCCTERYLQSEIMKLKPKTGLPLVLFALPPGENHFMGLLMAEGVMAEQGARTITIGSHIALDNISLAATACKADVVSLSFSFAYPRREVIPTLRHFRRLLPITVQIWVGGNGLAGIRKYPKGVRMFSHLNEVVAALNDAPVGPSAR
jgi:hypothetical protein